MNVIYVIPVYFIIALIVILLGGIWQIASGVYMALFVSSIIVGIIAGIYAIVKTFGVIAATKRAYLLIPPVAFLLFSIVGCPIFRQSFCLSEKWAERSGMGTLMVHDNVVFRWALLATLVISVLFAVSFIFSCRSKKLGASILLSFVALVVLVIPIFAIHSWGENQYYKNHSQSYEAVYKVKEDVAVELYINTSYRGGSLNVSGEDDMIRKVFPKKLKKGETVYGEAMSDGRPIEVFNDNGAIGDVPTDYLEPQNENKCVQKTLKELADYPVSSIYNLKEPVKKSL